MQTKLTLAVIAAVWLSYIIFAAGYYADTFALFK